MDGREALKRARDGEPVAARVALKEAMQRGLSPVDIAAAGRLARRLAEHDVRALTVHFLGEVNTRFLADATAAWSLALGLPIRIVEAPFDQVVAGAAAVEPGSAVVLVPRADRAGVLDTWQAAWALTEENRLVQIGWDLPLVGPMGERTSADQGPVATARAANQALRDALPPGAWFVDAERVAGDEGRRVFYDARQHHWTGQPWSPAGVSALAHRVAAGLRALVVGPRKVLVLDLDNTLWGGIVGELGGAGVQIGQGTPEGRAFAAFQTWCKGLRDQGVLLAACSKNDPEAARAPFVEHPEMVLTLDDFTAFEASWEPKPAGLERIAATLGLSLGSMVFVDDNPAEREAVRQALPDVGVVEVPEDPSGFISAVERGLWFESLSLTDGDRQRPARYAAERERQDTRSSHGRVEGWLASLDMVGDVRPLDSDDVDRATQLLGRTSQFNLTTRRHDRGHIVRRLQDPTCLDLRLGLRDRYGDHGLVGLILANEAAGTLVVDTLLMSCRVIGRSADAFFIGALVAAARRRGVHTITGQYRETTRNGLTADLWPSLGFHPAQPLEDGTQRWTLDLPTATPWPSFVRVETPPGARDTPAHPTRE